MPTSWKNGALPRMSSRKKIADYFGITVEELMGTKKEPAGMGELDKQMQEIVALLNSATRWKRCCAPGKAGVNQPTNGRSVLAGASVKMARTSGTRSGYCRRIARISSFVIMPKRSFLLYL